MLTITLKGLAANKARFTLTAFAVILAVSFVSASFVLSDGLRDSFGALARETATSDLTVRPVEEFGDPAPLDAAVLPEVRDLDGVDAAIGIIQSEDGTIRPLDGDGGEITGNGPPALAFNWSGDEGLGLFTLIEGSAPVGQGQFALDATSASDHGLTIGGSYTLITPEGRTEATLSGITRFGEDNSTLGATLMHLDEAWLRDLTGTVGYDEIAVDVAPGADSATVQAALARLAPDAEVIDQRTLQSEQEESFTEGVDIIGNILLGFAGISLFVSIFIIYNTFSIVLGQRTRELALLRTIGADPGQLRRSVLGEALVVGIVASVIGIAGGVAVSIGITSLFDALGAELPDSNLIVSTRTIIVALVIGIGATLVSAIGPARKASRVPPIAALRDGAEAGQARGRTRLAIGAALATAGAGLVATGLFAADTTTSVISLLAGGAIGVFVGVTMISPLAARPLTALFGFPLRRFYGASGRLAAQNAGRNPHRTATTASALMIGLALVSMVLVVGESVKTQIRETLTSSFSSDYLATSMTSGGLPDDLVAELGALPGAEVAVQRDEEVKIDGEVQFAGATDLAVWTEQIDLDIVEGSGSDPAVADPVLISKAEAEAEGLTIGDTVRIESGAGASAVATVTGIFADEFIIESDYLFDSTTWNRLGADPTVVFLTMTVDDPSSPEVLATFERLEAAYPNVEIMDVGQIVDLAGSMIDQALTIVNVLVALAVIIALVGIANTLALSVLERIREIGLLRAVGMSRRQVRRMIRLEAGLVALFGAALGVAVGTAFGWAAVEALPATIVSVLDIPFQRIGVLVVVAALAGLAAAWGPARRAGRLNVLDAIAH